MASHSPVERDKRMAGDEGAVHDGVHVDAAAPDTICPSGGRTNTDRLRDITPRATPDTLVAET